MTSSTLGDPTVPLRLGLLVELSKFPTVASALLSWNIYRTHYAIWGHKYYAWIDDFSNAVADLAKAQGRSVQLFGSAYLKKWGGSTDARAECIAAHVPWYYMLNGAPLENLPGYFVNETGVADCWDWKVRNVPFEKMQTDLKMQLSAKGVPRYSLQVPLYAREEEFKTNGSRVRIRVSDLHWYLAGWTGVDVSHATSALGSRATAFGICTSAFGISDTSGGSTIPCGVMPNSSLCHHANPPSDQDGMSIQSPTEWMVQNDVQVSNDDVKNWGINTGVGMLSAVCSGGPVGVIVAFVMAAIMEIKLVAERIINAGKIRTAVADRAVELHKVFDASRPPEARTVDNQGVAALPPSRVAQLQQQEQAATQAAVVASTTAANTAKTASIAKSAAIVGGVGLALAFLIGIFGHVDDD